MGGMKTSLTIPLLLTVAVSVAGCGRVEGADASTDSNVMPLDGELVCVPVPDPAAAIQPSFRCRDGRMCSDVRPEQGDGGVYQICPGTNGCATLVMSTGTSMVGFC